MKLTDFGWLFLGVALNAGAQLGLKAATKATGPIAGNVAGIWQSGQQIAAVPAFWLALFAYGLSVVVWLVGLSRVPVSQAYPILSLGYVLTALLAWPLLGEIVSGQRVLGIFVIIAGVWLITRS
ncbi:MAG: EamA family transporter [Steroidobacteraceae bacterium]